MPKTKPNPNQPVPAGDLPGRAGLLEVGALCWASLDEPAGSVLPCRRVAAPLAGIYATAGVWLLDLVSGEPRLVTMNHAVRPFAASEKVQLSPTGWMQIGP